MQTHLPDWYLANVLPESAKGGFDAPVGPQAEQIRLLTYVALAAGCKGLGFWSDRFLADSHQGRDRLLTLALLNQEIQMLEPLLFGVVATPGLNDWVKTSIPDVSAAVLRCDRGVLVLPMWLGQGAQFVPGQEAAHRVTLTVPQVPAGTQAWEVSPGEVRSLPTERVAGGTQVTLTEFDQTAAIVFTSDTTPTGLLVRWQEQSRRMVEAGRAVVVPIGGDRNHEGREGRGGAGAGRARSWRRVHSLPSPGSGSRTRRRSGTRRTTVARTRTRSGRYGRSAF